MDAVRQSKKLETDKNTGYILLKYKINKEISIFNCCLIV